MKLICSHCGHSLVAPDAWFDDRPAGAVVARSQGCPKCTPANQGTPYRYEDVLGTVLGEMGPPPKKN